MSPDRAREVIQKQSEFPYWGNYHRFMPPDEIIECRELFRTAPSGTVSVASIIQGIARQ